MRSPFPGMDPYLEQHWRDVHASLIIYSRDAIRPQLPAALVARVEEGVTIDMEGDLRAVAPDVRVVEDRPFDAGLSAEADEGGAVAVAEPLVVNVAAPFTERHIEIRDTSAGMRVVTVIEFLSPTNKNSGEHRDAYRRKQREYLAGGVNLVEVDLIRSGIFTLAAPLHEIPEKYRTPYMACVRRVTTPAEAAIYRATLRERLPAIPIPLRPHDRDAVLDLQEMIDLCYERGTYNRIDYRAEAFPLLAPDEARWADELLRKCGRR